MLPPRPPCPCLLLPGSRGWGGVGLGGEGPVVTARAMLRPAGPFVPAQSWCRCRSYCVQKLAPVFLESSITHTLSSGSAHFLSPVTNNLLFKQTGFLLHLGPFLSAAAQCSIYSVSCFASRALRGVLTRCTCRGFLVLLVLIAGVAARWRGSSLRWEPLLPPDALLPESSPAEPASQCSARSSTQGRGAGSLTGGEGSSEYFTCFAGINSALMK